MLLAINLFVGEYYRFLKSFVNKARSMIHTYLVMHYGHSSLETIIKFKNQLKINKNTFTIQK